MATQPTVHPVNHVVNRPLLFFGGVPRHFVAVAGAAGMVTLNITRSFVAGVVMGLLLYVAALVATTREKRILHIVWAALTLKARYDPAKHDRFMVKVPSR
jgi:type IV secretory pathway VirB3-like protein